MYLTPTKSPIFTQICTTPYTFFFFPRPSAILFNMFYLPSDLSINGLFYSWLGKETSLQDISEGLNLSDFLPPCVIIFFYFFFLLMACGADYGIIKNMICVCIIRNNETKYFSKKIILKIHKLIHDLLFSIRIICLHENG